MSAKSDLLEQMMMPFYDSLYERFHKTFGVTAEITRSQDWEIQRLLKPFDRQIESIIADVQEKMEEWLEEEHLHWVDEYDENCDRCISEQREQDWEDRAEDYHYRISV